MLHDLPWRFVSGHALRDQACARKCEHYLISPTDKEYDVPFAVLLLPPFNVPEYISVVDTTCVQASRLLVLRL